MWLPFVSLAVLSAPQADCRHLGPQSAPRAVANDNRTPAGTLANGVLTLHLVAQPVTWFPESDQGCGVPLYGFAEEGKPPQIPGPLIRVPQGTEIRVTIRNALPQSMRVTGFRDLANPAADSLQRPLIPADSTRQVAFRASMPGTYFYWSSQPNAVVPFPNAQILGQLVGGLIVETPEEAARAEHDRVLIMTRWRGNGGPAGDLVRAQRWEITAFNGRSWPHTERFAFTVGDTVRWRVIAANNDGHQMHLHGFYFLVESKGAAAVDSVYAEKDKRLVVTETMAPGSTMKLRWIPERSGNWIFHCHLMRHMTGGQRLDRMPRLEGTPAEPDPAHDAHAMHEMAGLVVGITVSDRQPVANITPTNVRRLHLYANERDSVFGAFKGFGFVLQRDARVPAADSVRVPGSLIVLRRGEPTRIVVHNRLKKSLSVHWHGMELESYSDGVAGWSGSLGSIAPPIAPGDTFVARMTPPRAGTFIYHVHSESGEELVAGLYGPMVVIEPGAVLDSARTFIISEAGPRTINQQPFVNGTVRPDTQDIVAGQRYRLRIIVISANTFYNIGMEKNGVAFPWRAVATDGADLPLSQAVQANRLNGVGTGSTHDYEIAPREPGIIELVVNPFVPNVQLSTPTKVVFRVRQP